MKHKAWLIVSLILILALAVPAFAQAPEPGSPVLEKSANPTSFLVKMAGEPVISYTGGVRGLRATAVNGAKIDPTSAAVKSYATFLSLAHTKAVNAVGAEKLYSYVYTFNGFAARMTPAQAEAMKSQPGVVEVVPDELQTVDTVTTPTFLGLDAAGGLWAQLGGTQMAGEGIIVGVVDSGIWAENASFAYSPGLINPPYARWYGICQDGEQWTADLCNGKIVGARYFNAAWGGDAGIDAARPWEFNSPRDYNGHGSHTSSTAAGNYGVDATLPDGTNLGKVSGMAPRARIAMYKALWSLEDGSQASGYTSDLVAAIDQAVADGVDVINYSISGSQTTFTDFVAQSFLSAARAGVFVANSAGNSGPTASTVAHNTPWVTTVAAGTHDRLYQASVTLGDGSVYYGVSIGAGTPVLPVVLSTAVGLPGADPTMVRLCYAAVDNGGVAVLDPALVAGKIVVCDRGTTNRVNKSLAVYEAGGLGMILTNTSPTTLNADIHSVPTVHTDEVAGAAIKAYVTAAGASATAQLGPGAPVSGVEAPTVASFSSRGPARAGGGDLLKPDIMAPGVDVLAAVSPAVGGQNYAFYQGTSMSSPHIAGIAALLKQAHPTWSPMAIKSAMMTTASTVTNAGNPIPGNNFGYGSGQVVPNSATDPGLVYDSGLKDWVAFLCGQGLVNDARCPLLAIDASNVNVASIAVGDLAGSQTITRRVTNVSKFTETYTASVSLPGFTAEVTPASFTIKPLETKTYTVKFTRTDATLGAYTFGKLVWTGSRGHVVTSAVALRPVALAAPAQVSGDGSDLSYNVTFGYDGSFLAEARGLVPALTFAGSINTGEALAYNVDVPAGTTYARFSLFDAKTTPGSDLDLYVFRGATQVGSSGGGTSNEEVNLLNPTAATYTVYVDGYATANPSDFVLYAWVLGSTAAGNMAVSAPTTAVIGTTGTVALSFSGLLPATSYLGSVAYSGTAGLPNPTIVRIDTAGAFSSVVGQPDGLDVLHWNRLALIRR